MYKVGKYHETSIEGKTLEKGLGEMELPINLHDAIMSGCDKSKYHLKSLAERGICVLNASNCKLYFDTIAAMILIITQ